MRLSDKEVVVYTTPGWPWCHRVKEYLSKKGISFTEYNVAVDTEKARKMVQKTRQLGVPVTTKDNYFVLGFNPTQLDELLAK